MQVAVYDRGGAQPPVFIIRTGQLGARSCPVGSCYEGIGGGVPIEIFKQVQIKHILTKHMIESFNGRVLGGVAWLNEYQFHAVFLRPFVEDA